MAKMNVPALLQIEPPSELKFKGPFDAVIPGEMLLENVTDKPVVFKIKTTAPKQYCVRPNCGVIEAGKKFPIAVVLQPFQHDGKEKIKHKFLVLAITAPDTGLENVEELWKHPPAETVYESKLRCVLEMPSELGQVTQVEEAKVLKDTKTDQNSHDSIASDTKEENRKLIEENIHLKEEIQRLKNVNVNQPVAVRSRAHLSESGSFSFFVAGMIAVVAVVCGLVLGKYFV